jgi:hypothetical protein
MLIFSYVSKFHHYERFLSQIHHPFLRYKRFIHYWCHNLVQMDQIREDMKLLFMHYCANICEKLRVSFARLWSPHSNKATKIFYPSVIM